MASQDMEEQEQEQRMCWVYGFKGCPMQDTKCPKNKSWLGGGRQRFYTERRCRQTVYDHLMYSPWHKGMTSDSAREQALFADIERWEIAAEESEDEIDRTIQWEEELVIYDSEDLIETVNKAEPKGANKGGGKAGSSQDHVNHQGKGCGAVVPARKRPVQPAEPQGGPGSSRQVARINHSLERNIAQQTHNAYVFVGAMTKAEAALRAAARMAEAANRPFMDIPNLR